MLSLSVKTKTNYKVLRNLENSMPYAIEQVMKYAQEKALQKKRGSKDKNNILFEITIDKGIVTGRLYTNFDWALFLEYGTGNKSDGTMPHIGHTATFHASGMTYWFLPKSVADAHGKEFTPQRLINIDGELFYIMFASRPYPFMRPTAFELEKDAVRVFANALKEKIRK